MLTLSLLYVSMYLDLVKTRIEFSKPHNADPTAVQNLCHSTNTSCITELCHSNNFIDKPPVVVPLEFKTKKLNSLDPFYFTNPATIPDLCNNLPLQQKNNRGLIITSKKPTDVLKIFVWRQLTYMHIPENQDWNALSTVLCPFPPELQSFFDFYLEHHLKHFDLIDKRIFWERGYAPCWFSTTNLYQHSRDKIETCAGPKNQQYILTNNFTQFREADIVYIDYPFYDRIEQPPFYDIRRMPPRLAHQSWVLEYGGENVDYYPHIALPTFLQQFDLTMGTPGSLFDISIPLYGITEEMLQDMVNAQPQVPFHAVPEHYLAWATSNCWPRNKRNELMQELIDKIGAHSYGSCLHNIDFPGTNGRYDYTAKMQVLAGYPFTFVGENANCQTYVSEKVYNALQSGSIPIYYGAPDIAEYVPEGSYINVNDFKDMDELIAYIKTVDRSQYYKWKDVVKRDPTKFCKRCLKAKATTECVYLEHAVFL
ncbi:4-alpha-L-fucosyltransferase [Podila verticillata]|nr:4-alpha-L-fucosyltransferase [Podila verticillata]